MFIMTNERPAALYRNLRHHAAQLAHSRDEFQANFILWMLVEVLWFLGQIVFFSIIFGSVNRIGDWSKWEVVLLVGTHQIIAQLFQAFFFVNVANIPELVRTGRLDSLLVLPIDSQFAVSSKQFGPRQRSQCRARWRGSYRFAYPSRSRAAAIAYFPLFGRDRFRHRHSLFHHVEFGGGQFLDRARSGTRLRLFQLSQYRALS